MFVIAGFENPQAALIGERLHDVGRLHFVSLLSY